MGVRTFWLLVVLFVGCRDADLDLVLPSPGPEIRTELIVLECEGERQQILAQEAGSRPNTSQLGICDGEVRVLVLHFEPSLEALDIEPGRLSEIECELGTFDAEGCCLARVLPAAARGFVSDSTNSVPSFIENEAARRTLESMHYRRAGLRLTVLATARRVNVASAATVQLSNGRVLFLEEPSDSGKTLIREVHPSLDASDGTLLGAVIGEVEGTISLSRVVELPTGELLITSTGGRTRRGPPEGPFVAIRGDGTPITELLVDPSREETAVYGLTQRSGVVFRLEGERWVPFGPEVPAGASCRQVAGKGGQLQAAQRLASGGYLVPPSHESYVVPYPSGLWRVVTGTITWEPWTESDDCIASLAAVQGELWASTRQGNFFRRQPDGGFELGVRASLRDSVSAFAVLDEDLLFAVGEAGLLAVIDDELACTAPRRHTGAESYGEMLHILPGRLLVTSSEGPEVHTLTLLGL